LLLAVKENKKHSLWQYKDIIAVLSPISVEEFAEFMAEENMQDIAWVAPYACRHQEIVAQMTHYGPVLPAGFASLFSSVESLERLLEENYDFIWQFFNKVDGKQEWAVKGLIDKTKAIKFFLSQLLANQEQKLSALSQGMRYFEEQKLKASADKALNQWLKKTFSELAQKLNCHAYDFYERRLLSKELIGKDTDMISNWAFLVMQENVDEFRLQINEANQTLVDYGLKFELSGPWPPYSFVPANKVKI
ncbi:MAG: gas vesicle synthesis GvpLGvpF, partial [bacterium]